MSEAILLTNRWLRELTLDTMTLETWFLRTQLRGGIPYAFDQAI